MPRVSVVIPNWNGMQWLPGCLRGLQDQEFTDFETIIVDNGSEDRSVAYVKDRCPGATLIALPENRGFCRAANAGIAASRGDYIALLNTDTVPEPGWLANLVAAMDGAPQETGSLASLLVRMDDPATTDSGGIGLDWKGLAHARGGGQEAGRFSRVEPVFGASAGAALYRRSFFPAAGVFDERFGSYLEDVDLSLRGDLLGFTCLLVPSARVRHKGHGSGMPEDAYVCSVTRNRLMVILKNIPWPLIVTHLHQLLIGQLYTLAIYRRPRSSIRGYLALARVLPAVLAERRWIQPRIRLSYREIAALLERGGSGS